MPNENATEQVLLLRNLFYVLENSKRLSDTLTGIFFIESSNTTVTDNYAISHKFTRGGNIGRSAGIELSKNCTCRGQYEGNRYGCDQETVITEHFRDFRTTGSDQR